MAPKTVQRKHGREHHTPPPTRILRRSKGGETVWIDEHEREQTLARPTTNAKTPELFLTLPPELRNHIYELVLVEEDYVIEVTPYLKEPGLLSVNRQIRDESRKIWYLQNEFTINVTNCDATLYYKFAELVEPLEQKQDVDLDVEIFQGWAIWGNLMDWCFKAHQGKRKVKGLEVDCDDTAVIKAAHDVVNMNANRSWKKCREALQPVRVLAGRLDSGWLDGDESEDEDDED